MFICIAFLTVMRGKNTETFWDLTDERFAFFAKFFSHLTCKREIHYLYLHPHW